MSIFISLLAFHDPENIIKAKISILTASVITGLTGYLLLKSTKNNLANV
jgi:NhaA family Na+:H+ antiporter